MENFAKYGLFLNEIQKKALNKHFEILMRWKTVHNLTAATSTQDLYTHHYADSLLGLRTLEPLEAPVVYDLGSGAGFPGLMAAVLWPEKELYLVESSGKKSSFLRIASQEMGLHRVKVVPERVEKLRNIPFAITRAAFSVQNWSLLEKSLSPEGRVAFWLSEQSDLKRPRWTLENRHSYVLGPGLKRQVAVFHVEHDRSSPSLAPQ